ncbi:HEPN domain-containing protein [Lactococcus petauri]|uniref:ApeA N-terminal domain 1-containing protein n=1 Tax=Lactococcus petauri TaxID=1940789 RepID=UPI00385553FC
MNFSYTGTGKVNVQGTEANCHLYTNRDEGSVVLKLEVMEAIGSELVFPLNIEQLYVELSNGYRVMLLDCIRSAGTHSDISRGITTFTYKAEYQLTGFGEKESFEDKFDTIYFYTTGLLDWGGISAYGIDEHYKLFDKERQTINIYEDEDLLLTYGVSGDRLPVHESQLTKDVTELKQVSYFKVDFKKTARLNDFFEVFKKIKRLTEITTLKTIFPTKIEAYSNTNFEIYGEEKYPRKIEILSPMIRQGNTSNYGGMERLAIVRLEDLIKNDSIRSYMSIYERVEPIIELYLEMLHNEEISTIRLFLNVVEALETYHSRFKANTIEEFHKRIDDLISKIPDGNKELTENFLLGKPKNKKGRKQTYIFLKNRLADLIIADYKINFDIGDINVLDFPEIISATRNYYIHYDESIKDRVRILSKKEIGVYNNALIVILEFYIYSELGFREERGLRKKLYERWGNVSNLLMFEEAFARKYGV